MLELFARLYKIEDEARLKALNPEQRHELRIKESVPVMKELKEQLEEWRMNILPRSPIGIATTYTLNVWERLERIMRDGLYEIDNNLIENRIRVLALGRLCCTAHNLPYVGNSVMLAA